VSSGMRCFWWDYCSQASLMSSSFAQEAACAISRIAAAGSPNAPASQGRNVPELDIASWSE